MHDFEIRQRNLEMMVMRQRQMEFMFKFMCRQMG
jgi:heme/copper-type cytochrome/quinol oxidase subunit 2